MADPAFPPRHFIPNVDGVGRPPVGLTKREYFAGKAMAGLLADSNVVGDVSEIAKCAVLAADALIAELAK